MATNNEELLEVIRKVKNGDETAMVTLLRWYRNPTRYLAGRVLANYRNRTYAEYDDLFAIGQHCVIIAAKKFNNPEVSFHKYWYKTATREMTKYIHDCMDEGIIDFAAVNQINNGTYILGSNDVMHFFILEDEISTILYDPKNQFSALDIELFYKLRDGYNCNELAAMYGFTYNTIRNRTDKIKKKIRDILFNS